MIKESQSIHKIPYFDISTKTLESVNKIKHEYQDIMCVCSPTEPCSSVDRPILAGYKYQFNWSVQPTMEPISYKLKGYQWNAVLTYNNIGEDINAGSMAEILAYMQFVKDTYLAGIGDLELRPIVTNVTDFLLNEFDNLTLENKIFLKTKRFELKGEEYSPIHDLSKVCIGMNISSQIYMVNAKFEIIDLHVLGI